MINHNEKNVVIERFISPEYCPVCGKPSYGAISCKKCGLYFFRYQEKHNILEHEKPFFMSYYSGNRLLHNINFLLFLIAISVISILAFTNIPASGDHHINRTKKTDTDTLKENSTADASISNSVSSYQENINSGNDSKTRLLPIDSIMALYNGKESFEEGVSLFEQQNYFEASAKFRQALAFLEKSKHYESIALTSYNIAACYYNTKKYDDSLIYFENALYISHQNGFSKIEMRAIQGKSSALKKLEKITTAGL